MAEISAALVKQLRDRTQAAMMDCKKALVAANGDIDLAIDQMRKSGALKAEKKADRVAAEGIIIIEISDNAKSACMLEVNCETDFVAHDENFVNFAKRVASVALAAGVEDITALNELSYAKDSNVEAARKQLIAVIGENVQLRRVVQFKTAGLLGSYVHQGRIGVVVDLQGGDSALAKDIAMHIAAERPLVVSPDQVPVETIAKEREIFVELAKQTGKPADIIDKMVTGRINKYLEEVSLLGQSFIKDPDIKISALLKNREACVNAFQCFLVGEGIERQVTDFAAEVMAQVRA